MSAFKYTTYGKVGQILENGSTCNTIKVTQKIEDGIDGIPARCSVCLSPNEFPNCLRNCGVMIHGDNETRKKYAAEIGLKLYDELYAKIDIIEENQNRKYSK